MTKYIDIYSKDSDNQQSNKAFYTFMRDFSLHYYTFMRDFLQHHYTFMRELLK